MFRKLFQLNFFLQVLIFLVLHFFMTLTSLLVAYDMTWLDVEEYVPPLRVEIGAFLFQILFQPYLYFSDYMETNYQIHFSISLGWVLTVVNSLLWGCSISLIIHLLRKLKVINAKKK